MQESKPPKHKKINTIIYPQSTPTLTLPYRTPYTVPSSSTMSADPSAPEAAPTPAPAAEAAPETAAEAASDITKITVGYEFESYEEGCLFVAQYNEHCGRLARVSGGSRKEKIDFRCAHVTKAIQKHRRTPKWECEQEKAMAREDCNLICAFRFLAPFQKKTGRYKLTKLVAHTCAGPPMTKSNPRVKVDFSAMNYMHTKHPVITINNEVAVPVIDDSSSDVVMASNDNSTRESKRPRLERKGLSFKYSFLSEDARNALEDTARKLCVAGKGISACDESSMTIGKRFQSVGITNTEENRRVYRQMLFETEEIDKYLSGVILDTETLFQKSSTSNNFFPKVLMDRGIVPGVKPHLKVYVLPGTNGDTVMQGLDHLALRAQSYYKAGARFAKWRSPITIDRVTGRPTDLAIKANMDDLARYALICQSEGLMPIVEPDVSLDGDHTLEEAVQVNVKVQSTLMKSLIDHGVFLGGCTIKTNIVNPGKLCTKAYSVDEIAAANIYMYEQCFPVAIKGINVLSGGQSLSQASARLATINKISNGPWNISFSWSAAIQLPMLDLCKGKSSLQIREMAALYKKNLEVAAFASQGKYHESISKSDGNHASYTLLQTHYQV